MAPQQDHFYGRYPQLAEPEPQRKVEVKHEEPPRWLKKSDYQAKFNQEYDRRDAREVAAIQDRFEEQRQRVRDQKEKYLREVERLQREESKARMAELQRAKQQLEV